MKNFLVTFFLLFASMQASAQFAANNPVEMEHTVSVDGSVCTITFEASIADSYHLYSTTDAPNPTTISIIEIEGAEVDGALVAGEGALIVYDDIFEENVTYFEGRATFTQKFKLLGGDVRIKGVVKYQSCNNGACRIGQYSFEYSSNDVKNGRRTVPFVCE